MINEEIDVTLVLKEVLKRRNIKKRLDFLKKKLKNKKVILYGVGSLFFEAKKAYDLSFINIIGVCDRKYKLSQENQKDYGYNIIPLDKIKEYDCDYILVCTRYYKGIINYLQNIIFKGDKKIKVIPLAKIGLLQIITERIKKYFKNIFNFETKESYKIKVQNFLNKYVDITNLPKAKDEKREIQLKVFALLKKIDEIAKENNLEYWLCSGTLLGAYRHKGFIPWDNDIDTCMQREYFEKAFEILAKHYKDSDFFVRKKAWIENNYQIRIINRYDTRIGMDIFPVDNYFKDNLTHKERQYLTERIRKARKIFNKKHPFGTVAIDEIDESKKDLIKIRDEFILENKKSIPNGALFYALDYPYTLATQLCVNYETVFPLKEIEFEGKMFPCPNKTEEYLENLYGDYMSFPI